MNKTSINLYFILLLFTYSIVITIVITFEQDRSFTQIKKLNLNSSLNKNKYAFHPEKVKIVKTHPIIENNICLHVKEWNQKKDGYDRYDRVIWNGIVYFSRIKQNHQEPKGKCTSNASCNLKKSFWRKLKDCKRHHILGCRKLSIWKSRSYPKNNRVKWKGIMWKSIAKTKKNQRPNSSNIWERIGICTNGLNCRKIRKWENNKVYNKRETIKWKRIIWRAIRRAHKSERPGQKLGPWHRIGRCRRKRKSCDRIKEWVKLKGNKKYSKGSKIKRNGLFYKAQKTTNSIPTCYSKYNCKKTKSNWIYIAKCRSQKTNEDE